MKERQKDAAVIEHPCYDPPRTSQRMNDLTRCGNDYMSADSKTQINFESKKIIDIKKEAYMNSIAVYNTETNVTSTQQNFSQKQIDILKNSICKGSTDEEFQMFLMACSKTQLDPFMRQIYAVKRKCKKPDGSWGESMTIQTGIDGYRLIAERTGRYAPGVEPTYTYDQNGNLLSATAYIKKQTADGTWHTVSASAYIDEYCQRGRDGQPIGMWNNMPRTMLAKCAESQALRKAFPAEMSGVYTKEEMQQAEIPKLSLEQVADIEMILEECDENYKNWFYKSIKKQYNADTVSELPEDLYKRIKDAATKNMEATHEKQRKEAELAIKE